MPRKRDASKPIHRRTRTGCDRCRQRKRRCDEAKPICSECLAKGFVDCSATLTLKWEGDFVGRAFGRAGVWSKNKTMLPTLSTASPIDSGFEDPYHWINYSSVRSYHFLNSFTRDFEDKNEQQSANTQLSISPRFTPAVTRTSEFQHLQIATPIRQFQNDLQVDPHLLSYYLLQLCPTTVLGSQNKSPFASLILPLAHFSSSSALMQSLMCLAASHRSRIDDHHRSVALRYSAHALRNLRQEMTLMPWTDTLHYSRTLAAMMLLCQSEITRNCDGSWVVHLKGAREIVRHRRQFLRLNHGQRAVRFCSPAIDFAERYFAFQDVMGRTACGEEPIFGTDFWANQESDTTTDVWLGCSPKLVSIVSAITELTWKHYGQLDSKNIPPSGYDGILTDLRDQLADLQQISVPYLFGYDEDPESSLIDVSAEAKRLAVEVYFYSALQGASPASGEISKRVQQILKLIFFLLCAKAKAGLTWPLFIAAVSLDPLIELEWAEDSTLPDDVPHYARPFVLYALEQQKDSLANIDRTRATIERVWRKREFAAVGNSEKSENDWAKFVAPFCHTMSLG